MQIFKDVATLRNYLTRIHPPSVGLGFVPTMGALHEGHLTLVRESVRNNELTACSIYVNPTQFNNTDDLARYPRSIGKDIELLENEGCDIVFTPDDAAMYPEKLPVSFDLGYLDKTMEGAFRDGHFKGVALIVAKLLNLIQPDVAYFGQKDLQQFIILDTLVRQLFFDVKMVRMPTIREADGLAMSSRNRRLTPEQRQNAPLLYQALTMAKENFKSGKGVKQTREAVYEMFNRHNHFKLEYFEIVDGRTLQPLEEGASTGSIAMCIAAYLGEIRLIDNIILEKE